jgi:threonine dehydratase
MTGLRDTRPRAFGVAPLFISTRYMDMPLRWCIHAGSRGARRTDTWSFRLVASKTPRSNSTAPRMAYKTIEDTIGKTPLVQLVRLPDDEIRSRNNVILGKLEGNNPAGSVKDRPALSMIKKVEARGRIKPGDTLIEATSGNTGIALAMAAAIRGFKMVLIMPEDLSVERRQSMAAYGAQILLTPVTGGMEYARDLAEQMQRDGKGIILDQFANADNPVAHYESTGPEIWQETEDVSRTSSRPWAPPARLWACRNI